MDLEDRIDIWHVVAKQDFPLNYMRLDFVHISQLTFQKTPFFLPPNNTARSDTSCHGTSKKVCSWSEGEPF